MDGENKSTNTSSTGKSILIVWLSENAFKTLATLPLVIGGLLYIVFSIRINHLADVSFSDITGIFFALFFVGLSVIFAFVLLILSPGVIWRAAYQDVFKLETKHSNNDGSQEKMVGDAALTLASLFISLIIVYNLASYFGLKEPVAVSLFLSPIAALMLANIFTFKILAGRIKNNFIQEFIKLFTKYLSLTLMEISVFLVSLKSSIVAELNSSLTYIVIAIYYIFLTGMFILLVAEESDAKASAKKYILLAVASLFIVIISINKNIVDNVVRKIGLGMISGLYFSVDSEYSDLVKKSGFECINQVPKKVEKGRCIFTAELVSRIGSNFVLIKQKNKNGEKTPKQKGAKAGAASGNAESIDRYKSENYLILPKEKAIMVPNTGIP